MGFTGPFGRAFQPPFATAGAAAPAGNGLLNNLIAYWPGNEAAGNALDLHTNALHLTDVNTVTSNPGLVYPLARQYTSINIEYHARAGDDALLSAGDLDFTIACWFYQDDTGQRVILAKYGAAGQRGYGIMRRYAAPELLQFWVSNDGTTEASVSSVAFGAPSATAWHLVVAWHDSVANQIGISIDDISDTAAHATGVFDNTTAFRLGATVGMIGGTANLWNGRIGPTMFWKSNAGLGGCLDATKRSALYNAGAGLAYAAFTL